MTWARLDYPGTQEIITYAYETLAAELGAAVVPCGLAWQRVLQEIPKLNLHRIDQLHPTVEGSYLNACCFYATLLQEDPRGLPAPTIRDEGGWRRTLPAKTARDLQRIAWETVSQGSRPVSDR
jgi:hypothetical protein